MRFLFKRKLLFAAFAALTFAWFATVQAQHHGGGRPGGGHGGGGFHSGGSPAHFGPGSITHREFNRPSGTARPEYRPNFQRPNLPNIPAKTHTVNRPISGRPDHVGNSNFQPSNRIEGNRMADRRPGSGPDWKNWSNFDASKIHRSVQNRKDFQPDRIDRIRRDFHSRYGKHDFWSDNWSDRHPGAWRPPHPSHRPQGGGPWHGPGYWGYRPHWNNVWPWFAGGFFGARIVDSVLDPIPYNYGNNIVYQGDTVYVNNTPYVSAEDYYRQALELADVGADEATAVSSDSKDAENDWMPMGTYGCVCDSDQENCNRVIQLATDKHGQIRGNLIDNENDTVTEIYGSVDPQTQRVAFKLKGNDETVAECGLWNLTQETVPLLVHLNSDKTEERTLVRLTEDGQDKTSGADAVSAPKTLQTNEKEKTND